jgi:hypothetical protein
VKNSKKGKKIFDIISMVPYLSILNDKDITGSFSDLNSYTEQRYKKKLPRVANATYFGLPNLRRAVSGSSNKWSA